MSRGPGRSGFEAALIQGATLVIMVLLLAPIVMVPIMSLTSAMTLQFPPPGWSLRWYEDVWTMLAAGARDFTRLREALITSVLIAAIASAICLVCGLPAAYAIARFDFSGRSAVEELLSSVPVLFPTVVLGVAMLVIISILGLDLGLFQIAIAHAIIGLPFMIRNCVPAINGIDPSLQEAAKTLGASPMRAFAEIVLPLAKGGIVSGALLVFILSFNEFTLTYFLHRVDVFPLSIWLFQQSNTSFNPAIFAVSTLVVVLNVLVIIVIDMLVGND